MNGVTRIEPPISFRRQDGRSAAFTDTNAIAHWLDRLYDAILDPQRSEGEPTWSARSLQLLEIEQILFLLAEESSRGTDSISPGLRSTCEALVACYRNIVMLPQNVGRVLH